MKKMLFIGLASVAALVPATIGLTANPSLSAKVPVPSIQVPLSTSSHDAGDDKGGQRSSTSSDDKGGSSGSSGSGKGGGSDDGAGHDQGDDHGGRHGGHGSDD